MIRVQTTKLAVIVAATAWVGDMRSPIGERLPGPEPHGPLVVKLRLPSRKA